MTSKAQNSEDISSPVGNELLLESGEKTSQQWNGTSHSAVHQYVGLATLLSADLFQQCQLEKMRPLVEIQP